MAPSISQPSVVPDLPRVFSKGAKVPLQSSSSLDKLIKHDVTPVIGTEFKEGVQIADLLSAPNSDDLIRDLAILGIGYSEILLTLVSQRNVVFFRNQQLTIEQQKSFGTHLGELSGKPSTSKLHIHPLTAEFSELGDNVTVISSENTKKYRGNDDFSKLASTGWHSE